MIKCIIKIVSGLWFVSDGGRPVSQGKGSCGFHATRVAHIQVKFAVHMKITWYTVNSSGVKHGTYAVYAAAENEPVQCDWILHGSHV